MTSQAVSRAIQNGETRLEGVARANQGGERRLEGVAYLPGLEWREG